MPGTVPQPLVVALESLKSLARVKAKEPKFTVGVDIGSSSLKVVVLGARKASGGRPLLGQRLVDLAGTPESKAAGGLKEAVDALRLPISSVNMSVSGQWVIMRLVEMPALKPEELKHALPFEAQRYLPFSAQEVVLDGLELGPAEGGKIWVLIVACKRDLLERRIAWIKQAGLEPAVVDVDALAVANAFLALPESEKRSGTRALINVGGQLTNLVVFKGDAPYLIRDIPWGGVKLIRHMAEQLGSEVGEVAAQLQPGVKPPENILEAMKVTAESLAVELQLSFDFFESRFGPPPNEIYVSGGTSQYPGFVEALKSHLAQPLTPWTPGAGLSNQFAVAYGLALRPHSSA